MAKIGNMTVDINMTDQDFATCVAVLFAGYSAFSFVSFPELVLQRELDLKFHLLVQLLLQVQLQLKLQLRRWHDPLLTSTVSLQIPSNMIAGRVSIPGIYICCFCGAWGAVSACTAAAQSYAGMVVCRLILGFTEAAFFPGAVYLLSLFYTRKQLALRTGILYSGSQIGNAFGGLFALGCLQLDGAHGLEGWRWLFIIEGGLNGSGLDVWSGFDYVVAYLTSPRKD